MSLNRITIFTSEFPPQPGGIGNHAYNLAKYLNKSGYEVKVLCDRRSIKGEEEELFDAALSFPVIRIPRKKILIYSYLHRIIQGFKLAGATDIIIASGKFPLWLGGFLSLFYRTKNIAVIHGSELLQSHTALRKLTKFSLSKFDKIIAVSDYTRSLLKSLQLNSVEVIHNGFEINCNVEEREKPEAPVLVTVGNVTRRKGQQNVIRTLPVLLKKYPDLQYRIIGIPTERDNLLELAKKLNVEKSVKFYGAVDEKEKCRLLLSSHIFIMLSESTSTGDVEGFGIAILEANSLGLPAIGAKECGIEEAIKDSFSGILVNAKDPKEILDSVDRIMEHYEQFSMKAKKWSSNFSWEEVIRQYIKVIESR